MKEVAIKDKEGKVLEYIAVPDIFKGDKINPWCVYYYNRAYLANQRQGTACTKTRSEVRGGGRKPWPQKHTRRARAGSIRAPQFKGGGVVFGPNPKDWSIKLPKKIKRKALISAIAKRFSENKVVIIDEFSFLQEPKTKIMFSFIKQFNLEKPLFVSEESSKNLMLSVRNIPNASYMTADILNAYEVLRHKELVLSKSAFEKIKERLKNG